MKTEKKESDNINPNAEELPDLSADEQAEHTKGGPTINFQKISYRQIEYDRL